MRETTAQIAAFRTGQGWAPIRGRSRGGEPQGWGGPGPESIYIYIHTHTHVHATHLCMYETCVRVCCACLGDSASSLFNPATSSKPEPASRSPGTRMFCEFHALSTPWPGCSGRILFHKPRNEARLVQAAVWLSFDTAKLKALRGGAGEPPIAASGRRAQDASPTACWHSGFGRTQRPQVGGDSFNLSTNGY